jgi:hypothetical protein
MVAQKRLINPEVRTLFFNAFSLARYDEHAAYLAFDAWIPPVRLSATLRGQHAKKWWPCAQHRAYSPHHTKTQEPP